LGKITETKNIFIDKRMLLQSLWLPYFKKRI